VGTILLLVNSSTSSRNTLALTRLAGLNLHDDLRPASGACPRFATTLHELDARRIRRRCSNESDNLRVLRPVLPVRRPVQLVLDVLRVPIETIVEEVRLQRAKHSVCVCVCVCVCVLWHGAPSTVVATVRTLLGGRTSSPSWAGREAAGR
jgi:hypothetical protein